MLPKAKGRRTQGVLGCGRGSVGQVDRSLYRPAAYAPYDGCGDNDCAVLQLDSERGRASCALCELHRGLPDGSELSRYPPRMLAVLRGTSCSYAAGSPSFNLVSKGRTVGTWVEAHSLVVSRPRANAMRGASSHHISVVIRHAGISRPVILELAGLGFPRSGRFACCSPDVGKSLRLLAARRRGQHVELRTKLALGLGARARWDRGWVCPRQCSLHGCVM